MHVLCGITPAGQDYFSIAGKAVGRYVLGTPFLYGIPIVCSAVIPCWLYLLRMVLANCSGRVE